MAVDAPAEQFDRFLDRVKRITAVKESAAMLRWDQKVMMPAGGTPARAAQLSTLAGIHHDLVSGAETGSLLDSIADDALDADQAAIVREVRREHERASGVPTALVEDLAEVTSNAHPIWEQARADDDFASFEPYLRRIVELKREYAANIDPDGDPYAVLFAEYEPYLAIDTAERVLGRLRDELGPLIDAVKDSAVEPGRPFDGHFDESSQEAVVRDVLEGLGYDWDRGRLDTSTHPFSTGNMFDARVTTRYDDSHPLESVLSAIHEFGHANYDLGLPEEWYGTPLADIRSLTVHESQSRFWENHVGRTGPYWEYLLPTVKEAFPQLEDYSAADIYETVNRIYPENTIRVDADELTYHMHIVVRFEIERDLIRGEIGVDEVPKIWNDKLAAYLGVRPETDTDGCLQDIHWSSGSFGYFPTYSLGSVLAAQLHHHLTADIPDYDERLRTGDFAPIQAWLRDRIHQHGCRFTTPDLIEQATDEELTADYFLEYAHDKFGALYGL